MKKKLYTAAVILLVLALAAGLWKIAGDELDRRRGTEDYAAAAEAAGLPHQLIPVEAPAGPQPPGQGAPPDPWVHALAETDLGALRAVNPEVAGWLAIPDTAVSYPLVQGANNQYYLRHTWSGENSRVGAIFMESQCAADMSDFNTIVYGHRLRSGEMFGCLGQYEDPAYLKQHPSVYLMREGEVLRYDVFAAYEAGLRDVVYRLKVTEKDMKAEVLHYARERSVVDAGLSPEPEDRILTLSTCTGQGYAKRWVVQAVLAQRTPV